MSFDQEFLDMMTQEIILARFTGDDAWGNSTYGVAQQYRCRVDNLNTGSGGGTRRTATVATPTVATTTVYMEYVTPVPTVRDKVTLPDGRMPTITSVSVEYDEDGPHHIVLQAEETRE